MVNNKKISKVKLHMLFSELNKINLNVMIQDLNGFEDVPDLLSCYIHNAEDWTIWSKVIDDQPVEEENHKGWHVNRLQSDLEDSYLRIALRDISSNLYVIDDDIDTNKIKVYAGEFAIDGTIDYEALIKNEDIVPDFKSNEFIKFNHNFWWTYNNGAFQWTNGPKSIHECRFSYGPFNGPDPHHNNTNFDSFFEFKNKSKLPNLNFIFDTRHVLKGIISLPCRTQGLKEKTQQFIEGFLDYYNQLSFKNIDDLLKDYCHNVNTYFPTIRVALSDCEYKKFEKSIDAIIDLSSNNRPLATTYNKYITPNMDSIGSLLTKSIWKNYIINDSFINVNNDFNFYTKISESVIHPVVNDIDSTTIMTLSDLFRQSKKLNKLYKEDNSEKYHVIVFPNGFANKNILKLITNIRYID